MGWNTYIVNDTGQDVWCFWSCNTGVLDYPGWDTVNFHVPAGHSCSSNRAGLCLFGFGAMFEPYPPAASVAGGPLGVPSFVTPQPGGTGTGTGGLLDGITNATGFSGSALNGVPVLWNNWNSSQGNACCHWGFRLVKNSAGFQETLTGINKPATVWTYPGPTAQVAQSQSWISGSGMFAAYPASTSGCP